MALFSNEDFGNDQELEIYLYRLCRGFDTKMIQLRKLNYYYHIIKKFN